MGKSKKLFIGVLSIIYSGVNYSYSFNTAQQVYNQLVSANHIAFAPKLLLNNNIQLNAYCAGWLIGGHIYLNSGTLQKVHNVDELAFALGHELGHFLHGSNETTADKYGVSFAYTAGFNGCQGATILKSFGKGDSVHPPGYIRWKNTGC